MSCCMETHRSLDEVSESIDEVTLIIRNGLADKIFSMNQPFLSLCQKSINFDRLFLYGKYFLFFKDQALLPVFLLFTLYCEMAYI